MTRLREDRATRRMVDTDHPAYRVGVNAANAVLNGDDYPQLPVYMLDAEVLMQTLVGEDPDVREHWGMYLILKGMMDTWTEYQQERST
jgi:hypothetical protein